MLEVAGITVFPSVGAASVKVDMKVASLDVSDGGPIFLEVANPRVPLPVDRPAVETDVETARVIRDCRKPLIKAERLLESPSVEGLPG